MKHPIPDAALDDRLGFVGTAGSGKTYCAGTCVERLLDKGARVVVVDPLGVWFGLRLIADGSSSSRYSMPIFGGAHGDLPLSEHAGALIGETVAGMTESCIISLDGLQTKSAERRFMLAFLDAIYRKANGEPVHIVFDEADLWAPQKSSEPMLQSRMEEICRRGRVKGLIPWLITQRPAVISKDVLSQVDGLVAFKLTSSQDRDALEGWIEGQADRAQWKEIRAALPTMERGQGVVWLPGRGVLETAKFPTKRTFDSSRTPKRGEAKRKTQLKPLDLTALKSKLATVEAEKKADDPKALRARIAELERQMRDAAAAASKLGQAPDPQAIEEAEQRGFSVGWAGASNSANRAVALFQQAWDDFAPRLARIQAAHAALIEASEQQLKSGPLPPTRVRPGTPERKAIPPRAMPAPGAGGNGHDTGVSPTVRKILDEIHRAYPVALTFDAASMRAAVSRRSSAYTTYQRQVEASPEIERRADGRFQSAPGYATPMAVGANPIEAFAARLPPSYAGMLRAIAASASPMTKEEIASAANVSPTSSGLTSGLRELMALSLVERDGEAFAINSDLAGAR